MTGTILSGSVTVNQVFSVRLQSEVFNSASADGRNSSVENFKESQVDSDVSQASPACNSRGSHRYLCDSV